MQSEGHQLRREAQACQRSLWMVAPGRCTRWSAGWDRRAGLRGSDALRLASAGCEERCACQNQLTACTAGVLPAGQPSRCSARMRARLSLGRLLKPAPARKRSVGKSSIPQVGRPSRSRLRFLPLTRPTLLQKIMRAVCRVLQLSLVHQIALQS